MRSILKFNHSGFTIAEFILAFGITAIVAVGSSAMMLQGLSTFQNQTARAESSRIAGYIRMELQSRANTRKQYSGSATAATSADKLLALNCGGALRAIQSDHAILVSEATSPQGTRMRANLISGSLQSATTVTYGGVRLDINELVFANADVLVTDSNRTLLSGELYLETGKSSTFSKFRRQFISRMVLNVSSVATPGIAINDLISCNVQTLFVSPNNDCIGDDYYFDTVAGHCVRKVSDFLQTNSLCGKGYFGNSDGSSNATCVPLAISCGTRGITGIRNGVAECSSTATSFAGTSATALPTPPTPPVGLPTTPAPTPGGSTLPIIPPTIVSKNSCLCGTGTIPHGGFCSYCVYDVDYGYGTTRYGTTLETIYDVYECQDGALVPVSTSYVLTIPGSITCNGSYRPASYFTPGDYSRFYLY